MRGNEKDVIKTLLYSDIFDYPLTFGQTWYFLGIRISKEKVKIILKNSDYVERKKGYYFLSSRSSIVDVRIERKKESQQKFKVIRRALPLFYFIPTITYMGISGALAMENAHADDDIDLFIITKPRTVWVTRLLVLAIAAVFGIRRKRNQKRVKDKICFNMFIDEDHLVFEESRRDLFTAREIVQLKPLIDRSKTYRKFILANIWVEKFLPNAVDTEILRDKDIKQKKFHPLSILVSQYLNIFLIVEFFAKKLQLWYMKKPLKNEIITDTFIAFHPFDYREVVQKEFRKRLKIYENV